METLQAVFWGVEKELSQEDLDAMWTDVERVAQFLAEKESRRNRSMIDLLGLACTTSLPSTAWSTWRR